MKKIKEAINTRENTHHGIWHDLGIVLEEFSTNELVQHFIDVYGEQNLRVYVEEKLISGEINKLSNGEKTDIDEKDKHRWEAYDWYKNNKSLINEYALQSQCFMSVDFALKENVDKEVYSIITQASIEAYLHCDSFVGITQISEFLALGYSNDELTLQEIECANKYDILSAVEDGDYNLIKEKSVEM